MNYSVYCHTLKSDGRKYIGITGRDPKQRWKYGCGYSHTYFANAIKKYGWNAFDHVILLSNLTKKEAEAEEIRLIALYNTTDRKFGFNITKGGDGTNGYKATKETKEKLRKSHLGKKQSKETIEKRNTAIAEYYLSHPRPIVSREHIMQMVEAHKNKGYSRGYHIPEETKNKLRLVNLGKKASCETKKKMREHAAKNKKVRMLDMDRNYIRSFISCAEAARFLGLNRTSKISMCANGKIKTAYNYKWEYEQQ